jgi:hypothetical protein
LARQAEEFDLWMSSGVHASFWVKRHRFEKTQSGDVIVDGGFFRRDEAQALFKMLTSPNPLTRLNATLVIWERNRTLLILTILFASVLLALVLIRVRR